MNKYFLLGVILLLLGTGCTPITDVDKDLPVDNSIPKNETTEVNNNVENIVNSEVGYGASGYTEVSDVGFDASELTIADTIGWEEYTEGADYGFNLFHPSTVECSVDTSVLDCSRVECKESHEGEERNEVAEAIHRSNCVGSCEIEEGDFSCLPVQLQIVVYPNNTEASLEDFCNSVGPEYDSCDKINYKVGIKGQPAVRHMQRLVPTDREVGGEMLGAPVEIINYIYVQFGEKNYFLQGYYMEDNIDDREAFEGMLSTFEF